MASIMEIFSLGLFSLLFPRYRSMLDEPRLGKSYSSPQLNVCRYPHQFLELGLASPLYATLTCGRVKHGTCTYEIKRCMYMTLLLALGVDVLLLFFSFFRRQFAEYISPRLKLNYSTINNKINMLY